jgi:hypothetical protein
MKLLGVCSLTLLLLPLPFAVTSCPPEVRPVAEESASAPLSRLERHRAALEAKMPEGFTIIHQPPFFVIGDESPARVRLRAERTVKWAVEHLRKEYFEKDPAETIDIWLFKDRESYLKHTRELFGETPTTPFGYFSDEHDALIMNISTGGGTLVHEIVHPFVRANFPACPAWFNEGLASLYEQCEEKDGRIHGLTNWRLRGLQESLREGKAPSFKDLTTTTTFQFYRKDRGTNYAQARYLCYYLQEQGLLRRFFTEFRAAVEEDPSGFATLKKVLGVDDMRRFEEEWTRFVLKLRFDG